MIQLVVIGHDIVDTYLDFSLEYTRSIPVLALLMIIVGGIRASLSATGTSSTESISISHFHHFRRPRR